MLCCAQNAHHASSLCDIQSPQPQLSIFSCASIAFSPVSWNCLPQALLSAVAEQTTLELGGFFKVGVHNEWTRGQLSSELAICLLSACARCSEIFFNCFFFPFSGKYLSMKANMKPRKDEYSGLSAVRCSVSPGERRQDRGAYSQWWSFCVPLSTEGPCCMWTLGNLWWVCTPGMGSTCQEYIMNDGSALVMGRWEYRERSSTHLKMPTPNWGALPLLTTVLTNHGFHLRFKVQSPTLAPSSFPTVALSYTVLNVSRFHMYRNVCCLFIPLHGCACLFVPVPYCPHTKTW